MGRARESSAGNRRQLTLHGWLRLGVALLVLLAVIAGALAPLLAAARVALKWQPELILGCFKVEHTLPIWIQVGLVLVIGAGSIRLELLRD